MLPFDEEPDEVVRTPVKPKPVKTASAPSPTFVGKITHPMSEDRAALRFNVLLRRFVINGYRMESMLGKFRVWRGETCLSPKWMMSFEDAVFSIEQELLKGTNYPDIGKTLFQEIGELKSLLQEVVDENISEGVQTPLHEKIETKLKEC